MRTEEIIIVGAGPSGIAFAHTLKHKLGFDDFTVYEKLDGVGGTWRTNTYPGVGCDVPTILYSFSFNLNPSWSKELCDGAEILEYMESTVDKFSLRKHMQFKVECLGAAWDSKRSLWTVRFRDLRTQIEYIRCAKAFISAVGGISYPRDVKFEGADTFEGAIFHTARWDHNFDYRGKRVAVIGNGCSAAQVVPAVAMKAAFIKQYARSAQWYHERPNRHFTAFEKLCFKYVPLWERYVRLSLFLQNDDLVSTYMPGPIAAKKRQKVESHAKKYIHTASPEKYHDILVPDFPLGCKRRIFDPDYLEALHRPNLTLVPQGIKGIDATGIIEEDGAHEEFDLIVLATGFQVHNFLTPMEVTGRHEISLLQQWKENRGAQAYMGTYVHNFPNMAILFGPNTFPAHNSALFACEVQVEYVARTLIAPLIDGRSSTIEVKGTAEHQWVNSVHSQLNGSVFAAGCSNWYINDYGRNAASWPGYASTYWKETLIPRWNIFERTGGEKTWIWNTISRWIRTTKPATYTLMVFAVLAVAQIWNKSSKHRIQVSWKTFRSEILRFRYFLGSISGT